MLNENESCIEVNSTLTEANAEEILSEGVIVLSNSTADSVTADFSATRNIDSSLIAVMLEWQRVAIKMEKRLVFVGVSKSIESLIAVYGLSEIIQLDFEQIP